MGKDHHKYKHGGDCIGASDAKRKAAAAERKRRSRAKRRLTDPFYN